MDPLRKEHSKKNMWIADSEDTELIYLRKKTYKTEIAFCGRIELNSIKIQYIFLCDNLCWIFIKYKCVNLFRTEVVFRYYVALLSSGSCKVAESIIGPGIYTKEDEIENTEDKILLRAILTRL